MKIQSNGELATDRFGNKNSSLFLNDGYATVPPGVYFNPDSNGFTIMAWMRFKEFTRFARLIEFGLGEDKDNIYVSLDNEEHKMRLSVRDSGSITCQLDSTKLLIKNQWFHLATAVNGKDVKMYIDGVLTDSLNLPGLQYNNIERSSCLIGGSNWNTVTKLQGYIDELKIFDRGLNEKEVVAEKNNQYNMITSRILNVYSPTKFTTGLTNYWPISGSTIDLINGSDMTIVQDCSLTEDRFGNPDSALLIELGGYAKIPSGIYFDPNTGGFTIMVWAKLLKKGDHQTIIDVGLGANKDNIIFNFRGSSALLRSCIFDDSSDKKSFTTTGIEHYKWSHVALAVNGNTANIYINGELSGSETGNTYRKIERTSNFIGKSNLGENILGVLDDLKIFNRGLDQSGIQSEMNRFEPYEQINID